VYRLAHVRLIFALVLFPEAPGVVCLQRAVAE
jgi:hypothetical protein